MYAGLLTKSGERKLVTWQSLVSRPYFIAIRSLTSVVCGSPLFEYHVRRAVRASCHDMHLFSSLYQMDESTASKAMVDRLN